MLENPKEGEFAFKMKKFIRKFHKKLKVELDFVSPLENGCVGYEAVRRELPSPAYYDKLVGDHFGTLCLMGLGDGEGKDRKGEK